ncbi:MAG: hypothetical protein AB8B55_13075 [Mariniblastus sp.]
MVELDEDFVSILISFLEGAGNAGEVLNDYLEDHSQPRLVPVEGESTAKLAEIGGRLAFVVNTLLPAELACSLACDFSQHAIEKSSLDSKVLKQAKTIYKQLEDFNKNPDSTFEDEKQLMAAANKFLMAAWKSDGSPDAGAAWSVWATVMAKPGNVAKSAQGVSKDEFDWQIDHLKKQLQHSAGMI